MTLYDNDLYTEDLKYAGTLNLPWDKLKGKALLLSGASGLIGSFLTDVIMYKNETGGLGCKVYALCRNEKKAAARFEKYKDNNFFKIVKHNINDKLVIDDLKKIDYVLHLASNTHPVAYASDPVNTITTNIIGTKNMLDFAYEHNCTRFAFASSNEIYGENRGDTEFFDEKYCGYINCNTLRAGYPESKRCGETLCQAYIRQYGMDIVIPRLTRTYGPTLLKDDTKALSQFLNKAVNGENIVLKSEGKQFYSYTYAADAVAGLLTVLLCGECGEAYNISDKKSDITLKDLAQLIADYVGTKVVFELPDELEARGYSTATKARLASEKINLLGWKGKFGMKEGIERTIDMLKQMDNARA